VPLFASHLHALVGSIFGTHVRTTPLLATLPAILTRLEKAPSAAHGSSGWGLTPRELEVATWLTLAKNNPEIAVILGMGRRTVEKHVERILEKLGVENRTAAALLIATEDKRAGSR
jgi:DNA-binding CsgD family transcriptional regulator